MRLLRVAPARQTALDLGPTGTLEGSAGSAEREWWQLPEPARVEVITLLARLIARGVLVESPPTGPAVIEPPGAAGSGVAGGPAVSGSGEAGE